MAQRVKGSAFGADVEIILLASLGEKGHVARCKGMGISGYLTKPVKQSEIFDAIVMALGHSIEEKTPIITRHSIQDGIAGGDAGALEQAAHALKGSVGNFGAGRAYETAYLLERLGNEGKIGEAEKALADLKKELNALAAEIKSTLREMKNESSDCRR